MSASISEELSQQQKFNPDHEPFAPHLTNVPSALERATLRLEFPPSYVIVGVYRLATDKSLYVPIWNKCKHGFIRGLAVGAGWAVLTFGLQRKFVKLFLINSPSVTGLSHDSIMGFKMPFDVPTYATFFFLASQLTFILTFFLSRNLRIARQRAWDLTIASRGKGPDFWSPYVEEWDAPPVLDNNKWAGLEGVKGWLLSYTVKRVILFPLHVVPFVGVFISAFFKSVDTARYLHRPYFESKKMTRHQTALFVAEHKWDYRTFGFTAALLETIPFIGLLFSVSNRIGAAMWAHDLEKRQHYYADEKAKKAK